MASYFSNGRGGSVGDPWAYSKPFYSSGVTWYVLSTTGTDAASPAGRDRNKPLATLAQAYTNAAAGDTIQLLSGHSETLTSAQTIAKRLLIVGEYATFGASTMPTFKRGAAAVNIFTITSADVMLAGIRFAASADARSTVRISAQASRLWIRNCYFESDGNDEGATLEYATGAAADHRIENTTFISTATAVSDQPYGAILVSTAVAGLYINGLTLDGGTAGWSNQLAFDSTAAITKMVAENVSLLRDSDMNLFAGSTYDIHVSTASGSARVAVP